MTPQEQIDLALALNSLYPGQPALDASLWEVRDRLFIPQDPGLPVAVTLRHKPTGKIARPWRGSQTGWDWAADLRFLLVSSPFGVGRTEMGFTQYYANAGTESGHPLEPVDWIAGHSLGGPAATYDGSVSGLSGGAALLLIETPMPGDLTFAAWATPRFKVVHRWENPKDIVPDTPGRFNGYRDLLGDPTQLDFTPLGPPKLDLLDLVGSELRILGFNHHLPNCIEAFRRQYLPPVLG